MEIRSVNNGSLMEFMIPILLRGVSGEIPSKLLDIKTSLSNSEAMLSLKKRAEA